MADLPAGWSETTKPRIAPGDPIPIEELKYNPFRDTVPEEVVNGLRRAMVTDDKVKEELSGIGKSLKVIIKHLEIIHGIEIPICNTED